MKGIETLPVLNFKREKNKEGLGLLSFVVESNNNPVDVKLSIRHNRTINMILKSEEYMFDQIVSAIIPNSIKRIVERLDEVIQNKIDVDLVFNTILEKAQHLRNTTKEYVSQGEYFGGEFNEPKRTRK